MFARIVLLLSLQSTLAYPVAKYASSTGANAITSVISSDHHLLSFSGNNIQLRKYKHNSRLNTHNKRSENDSTTTVFNEGMFSILLSCNLPVPEVVKLQNQRDAICALIQQGLNEAAKIVQQEIYLTSPISVSATFQSSCGADGIEFENCTWNRELGAGAPSRWSEISTYMTEIFGLDNDYLYPSALINQYTRNSSSIVTESDEFYDIVLSFNSDAPWWFPSTSNPDGEGIGSGNGDGPPLVRTKTREFGLGFFPPGDTTIYDENGSSQDPTYDFRQVAIHELIHGMGFMSSWNRPLHPESLLPSNPIIDDITEKNSTIKVVTFAKSYIFDKMMMHSGTGVFMRDYAQAIRNESVKLSQKIFDEKPNINESELLAEWAPEFMSSKAYQLSKNLMEKVATTPMQLVTWYLDSSQKSRYVILHTPNEYSAGHSLGHVDSTVYGGTTEFLMRPYATAGVGLAAQTPRSKSTVLGAAVVGILCQMGYKNV